MNPPGGAPPEQECRLPGGVMVDGRWTRSAAIRQLTGRDEEWLSGWDRSTPAAFVQTALLSRCVTRIGDARPAPDLIRAMLVGDRDYLLLCLRRICVGTRFDATTDCPSCGSRIDLSFDMADIPVQEGPQDSPNLACDVSRADGVTVHVQYHLPTGADQERIARVAEPGEGAPELLESCVDAVDGVSDPNAFVALLDGAARQQLEREMEKIAPQVDPEMDIACPECGRATTRQLELAPFLLDELGAGAQAILQDVHALALSYHWPESDILDMPSSRRLVYLGLLQREAVRAGES